MTKEEFENMVNEVENGNTLYLNDFVLDTETYKEIFNQLHEVLVNSIFDEGLYLNDHGNYRYYNPTTDLIFFEN